MLAMDGSPEMIEHARRRLERFGDRVELRLFDLASRDWRSVDTPVDAVVSSLAIHHLSGNQKQELFRDINQMLQTGGVLAIADPVEVIGETATRLAAEAWDEAVHQRSLEVDGNTRMYEEFLRRQWNMFRYMEPDDIDLPSPLFDQLNWLMKAGFEEVNVHWLLAGHAVFSGRKIKAYSHTPCSADR
jgi:tRNA (cmo5U34)-methyltransferase